jgi:hypothetical protein
MTWSLMGHKPGPGAPSPLALNQPGIYEPLLDRHWVTLQHQRDYNLTH